MPAHTDFGSCGLATTHSCSLHCSTMVSTAVLSIFLFCPTRLMTSPFLTASDQFISKFAQYSKAGKCTKHISPNSTWFVTSRHDTFDVSSPCVLVGSSLSNSTVRHARLHALDTWNVSCRDVTWRAMLNLGYFCAHKKAWNFDKLQLVFITQLAKK